jgi:hypothetical protein
MRQLEVSRDRRKILFSHRNSLTTLHQEASAPNTAGKADPAVVKGCWGQDSRSAVQWVFRGPCSSWPGSASQMAGLRCACRPCQRHQNQRQRYADGDRSRFSAANRKPVTARPRPIHCRSRRRPRPGLFLRHASSFGFPPILLRVPGACQSAHALLNRMRHHSMDCQCQPAGERKFRIGSDSMSNSSRDVDPEITSFTDRLSEAGSLFPCRNCSRMALLGEGAAARVRKIQVAGRIRPIDAFRDSVTCASETYTIGSGSRFRAYSRAPSATPTIRREGSPASSCMLPPPIRSRSSSGSPSFNNLRV